MLPQRAIAMRTMELALRCRKLVLFSATKPDLLLLLGRSVSCDANARSLAQHCSIAVLPYNLLPPSRIRYSSMQITAALPCKSLLLAVPYKSLPPS